MEYFRFGRVLTPEGALFDDAESALEFCRSLESETILEQMQSLSFTTDDEGLLEVLINNKRHNITLPALKDLCKMLKVPASYINKFPGRDLVLENLNNNPYLLDNSETVKIVLWEGENLPVIAGVLPGEDPAMSYGELLSMMNDSGVFRRENCELDQIAFTGEEMALYFYLPESITQERFNFNVGYALHYSGNRAVDTVIHPFCRMTVVAPSGEPFDFDFEGNKKLYIAKRKKEDFLSTTLDLAQHYQGENLGMYYEEALKYGTLSRNLDKVKYAILKYCKSRAVSTYNYSGVKEDPNEVAQEIIPEYRHFTNENKDALKEMEPYAANNLQVDFYLPVYFNRIYTYHANLDSPYFMMRYRKAIGNVLNKILDDLGDLMVDNQPGG